MTTNRIGAIIAAHKKSGRGGVVSVCSAHPAVIRAAAELARDQKQPRVNARQHCLIQRAVGNRALIGADTDAESRLGEAGDAAQGIGQKTQLLRPPHRRVFIQDTIAVEQHQLLGKIKHGQTRATAISMRSSASSSISRGQPKLRRTKPGAPKSAPSFMPTPCCSKNFCGFSTPRSRASIQAR